MRYRLSTLLILLAVGPPVLAAAWWCFCRPVPVWVFAVVLAALIPELLLVAFCYGFGAICHLIGRLPGGRGGQE